MAHGSNQHGPKEDTSNDVSSRQRPAMTLDQAAAAMGVSRPSVERAKKRLRDDPAAREAVKRGDKAAVAELVLVAKPLIEARAKANQQGGQGGVLLPENSSEAIETREVLADLAGVSRDTIRKVERIKEEAPPSSCPLQPIHAADTHRHRLCRPMHHNSRPQRSRRPPARHMYPHSIMFSRRMGTCWPSSSCA